MTSPSLHDSVDFQNADRGFLAALEPCTIKGAEGRDVWNGNDHDFVKNADCPDTANPKLWRQAQLCVKQGLFKVVDGIFQVRGLDISNMTVVEGHSGIIIIDPLTTVEVAEKALSLYRMHRGDRSVTGLIYTHSHADHFGGAQGVLPTDRHGIPIIAPEGFLEHAVDENMMTGKAMSRRGVFMYGNTLPRRPDGHVGVGLGIDVSTGEFSLVPPNINIKHTGQEEVVDGVRILFQVTPGTEAPSEMNFFFPQYRALCMAENVTHTLHNLLTLRGALVRDARAWSKYINEAISLFADDSDALFASHHWPTWDKDAIHRLLSEQRDLYAYLHDQTVRLLNDGLTGIEIAEEIRLPVALQEAWHAQGLYGSVSHNVKAIYQRYMGWYDGNPAHLWEHPPKEAAMRYVACMGGIDEVVAKADGYAASGDLRFAATLLSHAVFASPEHDAARHALASVFDRLGYGAECSSWRNCYLSGAQELREGPKTLGTNLSSDAATEGITADQFFDTIAVRIDGPRAQHTAFVMNVYMSDLTQDWRLELSNGALTHIRLEHIGESNLPVDLTLNMRSKQLQSVFIRGEGVEDIEAEGDMALLATLRSLLSDSRPSFPLVTP